MQCMRRSVVAYGQRIWMHGQSLLPVGVQQQRWPPGVQCYGALAAPQPEGAQQKVYSANIVDLVDKIGKLTLLEVSQLNECLKRTLNISDVPMMPMGGAFSQATAAAGAAKEQEAQEEAAPKIQQSAFTVTLSKFDEKQKVNIIKEVKKLMEGMNLVQAKKFVESAPQVIKADIAKAEAETIKKALEAVGATVDIS